MKYVNEYKKGIEFDSVPFLSDCYYLISILRVVWPFRKI